MRWACLVAALALVVLASFPSASATTAPPQGDTTMTLVELLSAMYQIEPPANINIERVPMRDMIERYRDLKEVECRDYYRDPRSVFVNCIAGRPKLHEAGVFVSGWFVPEGSSKDDMHIIVWKGGSMQTEIHEWLHWYYYNHRTPPVFSNHENVYRETDIILASPRFLWWLMAREAATS